MRKNLIFFTSVYPYSAGEYFIEHEITFLSKAFEKIIIVTNAEGNNQTRALPPNVIEVVKYPYDPATTPLFILSVLFNLSFWKELLWIIRNNKLSKGALTTAYKSMSTGVQVAQLIGDIFKKNSLKKSETTLYSYWANDMAIGLAHYKQDNKEVLTVARAHGWDVYFERHNINYLPYRKLLANNLDLYCFISDDGLRYTKQIVGEYYKANLTVNKLGSINKEIPHDYIEHDTLNIVSCSSCIPLKRIHLIIEALATLPGDIKCIWTHIGEGELFEGLKQLAKGKLLSKPNIAYTFTGNMPNKEVLSFYQNNTPDVFINVSEFEGIPVSIMEALSCGVPVIATNVGGVSEIIYDKLNGILLNKNVSGVQLATVLTEFNNLSFHQRMDMRMNARKFWEEHYNAEVNFEKFVALITAQ